MRPSTDGTCGHGSTCIGSKFGECCSLHGFCGSATAFCSPEAGCQLEFGTCVLDNAAGIQPSFDGSCGNGRTCTGSSFGTCCSASGFCGSIPAYCSPSVGCQPEFGTCIEVGPSLTPSKDGSCGNGITCNGSKFGSCCSQHGYCGSTGPYCGADVGCQPESGTCQ